MFLSNSEGLVVVVALSPKQAILELINKSFDFVVCDGSGWGEVHALLREKMKGRYCVYTGDRRMSDTLKENGVLSFVKGAICSPALISDWVLTFLKDAGFDCQPREEVREFE